ncbi:MAG: peptidase T [Bacillota bacterium]|nr:peptidase T [Bacillota bacterium]
MDRQTLLNEGLLAKFLRYVKVDTASAEGAGKTPSTPGQLVLAQMLRDELLALGLSDATIDAHGFVTATLPGNLGRPAPTIGLLAHLDTFPGVPGADVKPLVHRNYQGGELRLPSGEVLRPEEFPALLKNIGHDLVTSDGTTLLGADDKSGIAVIMETLCRFLREPDTPHGPVKVAFTPDEEIGRGVDLFDVTAFGADVAYTLDGSGLGELEAENFNGRNYTVTITGVSTHTGSARGKMINAVHLAAEFVGAFPAHARPETTDGRQGFFHPDEISGNVEKVAIKVLARDFTREGIEQRDRCLRELANLLALRHPGATVEVTRTLSYDNMKEVLDRSPKVVALAEEAIRRAGVEPVHRAIRGGTDGARLSFKGLPTPNLPNGSENVHSRREWASVQWMEKAAEIAYRLVLLWAEEPAPPAN